jgi:DNA-binding transcriptional LysR family regulator
MPTIRMLKTSPLVAQTGPFAAAAEKAALTQAAVSLQMKGLEGELGKPPIMRSVGLMRRGDAPRRAALAEMLVDDTAGSTPRDFIAESLTR